MFCDLLATVEEDVLRREVLDAIVSLASPGVGKFDDRAALTKPPLNLTGVGLSVLAVKLARIAEAHGGGSVTLSEVKAAKTAGGCVDLIRGKLEK